MTIVVRFSQPARSGSVAGARQHVTFTAFATTAMRFDCHLPPQPLRPHVGFQRHGELGGHCRMQRGLIVSQRQHILLARHAR